MRFKNQLSLLSNVDKSILIIGVGGIGSTTAFILAKMGFWDITIVDDDIVEDHNIASQMYKEDQIGLLKVHALAENIKQFSGVDVKIYDCKWEPGSFTNYYDIIICCVDNMEKRKEIVDFYKNDFSLIIEARMAGTDYIIYSFFPINQYYDWLANWFPSGEALPIPCTEKSICFNTMQIGGEIGSIVRRYAMSLDIPFITQKGAFLND